MNDIAIPKQDIYLVDPEGEVVEMVSEDGKNIYLRREWLKAELFKNGGSVSFIQKRLLEQDALLPLLEARTYYSEERKKEVIDSARFIRDRFYKLLNNRNLLPSGYKSPNTNSSTIL